MPLGHMSRTKVEPREKGESRKGRNENGVDGKQEGERRLDEKEKVLEKSKSART